MTDCVCDSGWRIEATELSTGQVKAVLHCSSAEWEDVYCGVGVGKLETSSREPAAADIFPHTTGLYISRILPDNTRYVHWGGIVEGFSGVGDTTIGLVSIDEYLYHRYVSTTAGDGGLTVQWTNTAQQDIAFDLVALASPRGIPLIPVSQATSPTTQLRDRKWNWWEFKNIGQAIEELTKVSHGLRYKIEHTYAGGFYKSYMIFDNHPWETRDRVLKSDREVYRFALEVDAKDQATRVFAIGEGEEAAQKLAIAYDADATEPEWQATPAFKDVQIQATLEDHAAGHVGSYRDPIATPSVVLAGLDDPPPQELLPGDNTPVDVGFGVASFKGMAQVLSIAWRIDAGDEPVIRNVALLPLIRSTDSVKTQVPIIPPTPAPDPAPGTPPVQQPPTTPDPDPKPGLLCKIKDSAITESSYGQNSKAKPGIYWTGNDENGSPQIRGIDLKTGQTAIKIYFDTGTDRVDPEALRYNPFTNKLELADIGDNAFKVPPGPRPPRDHTNIFEFNERTTSGHVTPTVRRVEYDIGPANAECLMIDPRDGRHWIITKEYDEGHLLRGPITLHGGTNTFENFHKAMPRLVTDGTFVNSGKWVLLRVADKSGTKVVRTSDWKNLHNIPSPAVTKGESITMDPDGRSFLIGSEGSNSPIYRVVLPKAYR